MPHLSSRSAVVLKKGKLYHDQPSRCIFHKPLIPSLTNVPSAQVSSSAPKKTKDATDQAVDAWRFPVFLLASTTFILLWLASPPLELAPLAWLAPVPLMLVVFPKSLSARSKVLRKTYFAAMLFWLATFYFLPYPHPVLFIGWFALSAYLALYTPLFVVCARTMTHRIGVSPLISISLAWTGLEWIRVNFLTGFGMVCLSHTQYAHPVLIQISDLFGAYAVTFAMTAFAAGVAKACFAWRANETQSEGDTVDKAVKLPARLIAGVLWSTVVVGATVGYGMMALNSGAASRAHADSTVESPSTRIALIQSSLDTILVPPKGEDPEQKHRADFTHRMEISHRARLADDGIDLVVWPESSFPTPDFLSKDAADSRAADYATALRAYYDKAINDVGQFEPVPLIAGTTTYDMANESVYNVAMLIDDSGKVSSRYFKNHRVMIGEYTPILEYFPEVLKLMPFLRTLTAGDSSCVMDSGGVAIVPNICFETTVPHYLRNQLNGLAASGQEADVMLNITNDGWFFGSTCLDLHFACTVFRAVEMRKPMLVCANTGFSAHIAADGRVIKKGPRRATEFLICDVEKSAAPRVSAYRRWGSWIPFAMGWICVAVLIVARWRPK